jgi:hypothetical protein
MTGGRAAGRLATAAFGHRRRALEAMDRLADVPVHEGADRGLPDRGTPVRSPGAERLEALTDLPPLPS